MSRPFLSKFQCVRACRVHHDNVILRQRIITLRNPSRFQFTTVTPPPSAPPLVEPVILEKPPSKPRTTTYILTTLILGLPAIYLSSTVGRLEREYPAHPASSDSPLNQSIDNTRYSQHDVHIFSARIPIASLLPTSSTITPKVREKNYAELWTTAWLQGPTLQFEAKVIGFLTGNGWKVGDIGVEGLKAGQEIINGAMTVEKVEDDKVVVCWSINDNAVRVFEYLAKYGFPNRLMSGGRHTFEVVEEPDGSSTIPTAEELVTTADGEVEVVNDAEVRKRKDGTHVVVRFGCAHDYKKVNRINLADGEDGERIPKWVSWCHAMYARWLLDSAVEQLKKRGTAGWDEK